MFKVMSIVLIVVLMTQAYAFSQATQDPAQIQLDVGGRASILATPSQDGQHESIVRQDHSQKQAREDAKKAIQVDAEGHISSLAASQGSTHESLGRQVHSKREAREASGTACTPDDFDCEADEHCQTYENDGAATASYSACIKKPEHSDYHYEGHMAAATPSPTSESEELKEARKRLGKELLVQQRELTELNKQEEDVQKDEVFIAGLKEKKDAGDATRTAQQDANLGTQMSTPQLPDFQDTPMLKGQRELLKKLEEEVVTSKNRLDAQNLVVLRARDDIEVLEKKAMAEAAATDATNTANGVTG